jgi:hypothetical protein
MILEQAPVQFGGAWLEHLIVDPARRVLAERDLPASGLSQSPRLISASLSVSQTSASFLVAKVSGAG